MFWTKTFKIFLLVSMCIVEGYSQETCGKQKSGLGLIYGGSAVNKGEWPWVATLFLKDSNQIFCAGNLISNQHLLTAAHCVNEKGALSVRTPEEIYAYLGRLNISPYVNEPLSVRSNIKTVTIHPDWKSEDERYDADVAILTLTNPISFNEAIQPICLPEPDLEPFKISGSVVGYGRSETGKIFENIPRQIKIASVTNDKCLFSNYIFAKIASPRTFCAGEKGRTPCQGDSGGGFYFNNGSSQSIAGIVSSSIIQNCGDNEYVLFTNVAKFHDWITNEIHSTEASNSFDSIFDRFDNILEKNKPHQGKPNVNVRCTFKPEGTEYGCFVNDIQAPDSETILTINSGTHQSRKTNKDVTVMHMKGGRVTHFPEMTNVVKSFPKLSGFGITFTKLVKIDRSALKELEPLKFFLISDNEIEFIPADAFADLKNCELLDICRNAVANIEAEWIASMPKLRVFKARDNKFTNVPAEMFKNNPVLEEIYLDGNQITIIHTSFWDMKNVKSIAILRNPCINMKYCQIPNDKDCVRSIQQFSYFILGFCSGYDQKK